MPRSFLVATFSDADTLLHAVRAAIREDFTVYDVYAPYPIHGMDAAMGVRRSRLPWVTFIVGCCALTFALCFQFYTSVLDWPLNVGGKPDNSTLAFVPICFELTVLLSGLATVAAFFCAPGCFREKRSCCLPRALPDDTFALVLRRREPPFDSNRAWKLLQESGADRIREKEVES